MIRNLSAEITDLRESGRLREKNNADISSSVKYVSTIWRYALAISAFILFYSYKNILFPTILLSASYLNYKIKFWKLVCYRYIMRVIFIFTLQKYKKSLKLMFFVDPEILNPEIICDRWNLSLRQSSNIFFAVNCESKLIRICDWNLQANFSSSSTLRQTGKVRYHHWNI